jgi:hypothetical protein
MDVQHLHRKKISERDTRRLLEYDVGDRLKKSGSFRYKYDKDGYLVQRHNQQITFNSNGQFTGISKKSAFRTSGEPMGSVAM